MAGQLELAQHVNLQGPEAAAECDVLLGCDALFVSEHFTTRIAGLPEDESRDLLAQLFAHSVKPEHIYRHAWRERDLVFWDNRSLLHLAAGCPPEMRRLMYRTTIEGDLPV